jgi:hypothetical protein
VSVAGKFSRMAFGFFPFLPDDACLDRVSSEPEMVVSNRAFGKDAFPLRQCLAPLIEVVGENRQVATPSSFRRSAVPRRRWGAPDKIS